MVEDIDNEKVADESTIVFDGVLYGQVPQDLLRDPNIKLQAKAVYALLHSYSVPKALESKPQTFVSQKKIAANAGLSLNRLREWIKKLEETGWLSIRRRGLNKSNNYTLHAQRKRRR